MATKTVIDISVWNPVTDWSAVAAAVDGIIIRCGYRGYGTGTIVADSSFASNIKNAAAVGIPLSVYFFSTAITTAEAVEEADYVLNAISGYEISMPLFIDSEYSNSTYDGRSDSLSKATRTNIVMAFCAEIVANGYTAGVYASDSWYYYNLNWSTIYSAGYKLWVAKYSGEPTIVTSGCYVGWQYTSSNTLTGISSNVDTSHWYDDISAIDVSHCFPAYTGSSESLITALAAVGCEDTSLNYRKIIALYSGIVTSVSSYTGTATQNTTMLSRLKAGTLVDPSTYDDENPTITVTKTTCKEIKITASDDIYVETFTVTKNGTSCTTSRASNIIDMEVEFDDVDSGDKFVCSAVDIVGNTASKTYTAPSSIEHSYTSSFTWASNYSSCTHKLTCSECGNVISTVCTVTSVTTGTSTTCGSDSYTTYTATCTVNGTTYTDTKTVSHASTSHNYTAVVTEPTCTTKGYTTYTCSNCGDTYTSDEVAALGHNYEVTEEKDSSCIDGGSITYTCTRCGDTYTETHGSATGHNWVVYTDIEPTCTSAGYITYRCSKCGSFYTEDLAMVDHTWEAISIKEATCVDGGYTYYKCSVCGTTKTDDVVSALGHNYISKVTSPTCTTRGYTTHTCSRCDDTYVDTYTSPNGHSYILTGIIDATCEDNGYDEYVCSVCGNVTAKNIIVALGHSYEITDEVEVSCEQDGYTEKTCTRCGYVAKTDVTTAPGHDYEEETLEATCTTGGYTQYTCLTCGYITKDDFVDPLGHDFETLEYVAPTYKSAGYGKYECTRCGLLDNQTYDMLTLSNGEQIKVINCTLYPIPVSVNMDGHTIKEEDTFYIWNPRFVNDRVKITNSPDNKDMPGLITGWINIDEINKVVETEDGTKYSYGDAISVTNIDVYDSATAINVSSIRNGLLWISSDTIVNGRIPVTNKYDYVGNDDLYIGWVNVSQI